VVFARCPASRRRLDLYDAIREQATPYVLSEAAHATYKAAQQHIVSVAMERIDWLLLGIALLVVAVLAVWFLPNFETVCRPL
jgi:hypothetical protein